MAEKLRVNVQLLQGVASCGVSMRMDRVRRELLWTQPWMDRPRTCFQKRSYTDPVVAVLVTHTVLGRMSQAVMMRQRDNSLGCLTDAPPVGRSGPGAASKEADRRDRDEDFFNDALSAMKSMLPLFGEAVMRMADGVAGEGMRDMERTMI